VELDDGGVGIELRELLEPVERSVGPARQCAPDLRLERVVLREQLGGRRQLAARVQGLAVCQVTRLRVRPKAEGEGERRAPLPHLGRRGLRRARRTPVRGDDCDRHDRDRSSCDGADEKRDTTLRGHRWTIASTSKL
jgi:hypothetical protein